MSAFAVGSATSFEAPPTPSCSTDRSPSARQAAVRLLLAVGLTRQRMHAVWAGRNTARRSGGSAAVAQAPRRACAPVDGPALTFSRGCCLCASTVKDKRTSFQPPPTSTARKARESFSLTSSQKRPKETGKLSNVTLSDVYLENVRQTGIALPGGLRRRQGPGCTLERVSLVRAQIQVSGQTDV